MAEKMVLGDLGKLVELLSKEKGIERSIVVASMIEALETAAKKKYGSYREFEASYNEETGDIDLYEYKEVVKDEEFFDDEVEIRLSEAEQLDPEVQVGDMIGVRIPTGELGRIAAQTARQVLTQKVREAETDVIVSEFEKRKGEIASGIVRRFERDTVVVDLGRTEAYMPKKEQIPGEAFKPGDRVQGYISEVRQTPRGPQIIISRSDERYLMKLFEQEVPEIQDGTIEIMSAARDPGLRAKIAVRSLEPNVDPVGSCVGMKGSRVQNVIQELRGEKIDIVVYDEDITRFAVNALQPAKVSRIFLDEENKTLEVIVPDDQLSLAIGRKGQNVRLASKLTGWRIDVTSESLAKAKLGDAIFNLTLVPGINESLAETLYQYGITHPSNLVQLVPQDLVGIGEIQDLEQATKIINSAKDLLEQYRRENKPLPRSHYADLLEKGSDAKSQADVRLKQELEKLRSEEEEQA